MIENLTLYTLSQHRKFNFNFESVMLSLVVIVGFFCDQLF